MIEGGTVRLVRPISLPSADMNRLRLTSPVSSSVTAWRWTTWCSRAFSSAIAACEASQTASRSASASKPPAGGYSSIVVGPSPGGASSSVSGSTPSGIAPTDEISAPASISRPAAAPVASAVARRITGSSAFGLCVAASVSPTSASASRGSRAPPGEPRRSRQPFLRPSRRLAVSRRLPSSARSVTTSNAIVASVATSASTRKTSCRETTAIAADVHVFAMS